MEDNIYIILGQNIDTLSIEDNTLWTVAKRLRGCKLDGLAGN